MQQMACGDAPQSSDTPQFAPAGDNLMMEWGAYEFAFCQLMAWTLKNLVISVEMHSNRKEYKSIVVLTPGIALW